MSTLIRHGGVYKESDVIHIKHEGLWKEVSGKQFIPGTPMEGGFFAGISALSGVRYALILADKSAETSLSWKNAASSTSGTSSLDDGLANSNAMNNASHPAARYCRTYDGGGFDDWYLPATNELIVIRNTLRSTAPFVEGYAPDFASGGPQVLATSHWSSRQATTNNAYIVDTSTGYVTSSNKNNSRTVRPVRRVAI